jgi:CheY-like chemotaxis protein
LPASIPETPIRSMTPLDEGINAVARSIPQLSPLCTKAQCLRPRPFAIDHGKIASATAVERSRSVPFGSGVMSKARRRVVVVDDDRSVLKAVQRLLTAAGFDTAPFSSAEELLGSNVWHTADCFLFDIHLDGMSGIELRRQLAAKGCTVPVIFMSAFEDEASQRDVLSAGGIAFLAKPFAAELLMGAIAKVG